MNSFEEFIMGVGIIFILLFVVVLVIWIRKTRPVGDFQRKDHLTIHHTRRTREMVPQSLSLLLAQSHRVGGGGEA